MGKSTVLLFIAALAIGGWYLAKRYDIRGFDQIKLTRRDGDNQREAGLPPAARSEGTIRVASFNIQAFGPSKADKPDVMEVIARTIRQFDVVAIQELRSPRPEVLQKLIERVNAGGGHYSLLVGPPVGRTQNKEQYVFIFDQATLEVDRGASYLVDDPDDLLHRPPLVGWFRVRGPAADKAFTFTLVNVHTDPDEAAQELNALDDVFYAVRDDGRGEDDLIMLGDFNADDQHMNDLGRISGVMAAISGTPTNTRQTHQYDNLVFQLPATSEYAGRSGVFDFMREYNLTLDQALEVSDHLPVWAEFSMHEGGGVPAVATFDGSSTVR